MSMKTSTRQVDGVTIVDCSGRITLGEGSVILRDVVRDLLSKGQKKILLNLGDVNYIDSSGIGELVSAFTTVRNQGGELKLLNLTKKVHDLLQITKLYTVFDVKDDEASRSQVVQLDVLLLSDSGEGRHLSGPGLFLFREICRFLFSASTCRRFSALQFELRCACHLKRQLRAAVAGRDKSTSVSCAMPSANTCCWCDRNATTAAWSDCLPFVEAGNTWARSSASPARSCGSSKAREEFIFWISATIFGFAHLPSWSFPAT